MPIFVPLALFVVGVNLFLGIFLLVRARHNPAARVFAVTVFSIVVWSVSIFLETPIISHDFALFCSRLAFFSGSFIAASFLYFSIIFPKPIKGSLLIIKALIWGIGAFFAIISLSSLVIADEQLYNWGWSGVRGPLSRVFDVYFIIFMAIALVILMRKFFNERGIARVQLEYFLIGSVISVVGGATTNVIIPFFTDSSFTGYYGPYFSVFYVIFTTYAILKHRFFDIKVALRKGTIYAVTIAIVLGLYAYIVFIFSQTTSNVFKIGGDITSAFIIILVAVGFHPLRKLVEHTINEYIFVKRIDLRAAAEHLNNSLASKATNFENLLKTLRQELKTNLECDSVDLAVLKAPREYEQITLVSNNSHIERDKEIISHLKDDKEVIIAEELEFLIQEADGEETKNILNHTKELCACSGIAAIVPILTSDDLIGIMILGPKKSKAIYSAGDIKFLEDLKQRLSFILGGMILYYQALERIKRNDIRK